MPIFCSPLIDRSQLRLAILLCYIIRLAPALNQYIRHGFKAKKVLSPPSKECGNTSDGGVATSDGLRLRAGGSLAGTIPALTKGCAENPV